MEPLKNKRIVNIDGDLTDGKDTAYLYYQDDVKSAVEWLKARWPRAWALHKDIDIAFEDVK